MPGARHENGSPAFRLNKKGLDFLIACDWTPEQALAIIELLSDLQDRILNHYPLPTLALMREAHGITKFDELNITDFRGENELPF